jgi:hypothetical protein
MLIHLGHVSIITLVVSVVRETHRIMNTRLMYTSSKSLILMLKSIDASGHLCHLELVALNDVLLDTQLVIKRDNLVIRVSTCLQMLDLLSE